MNLHRRMFQIFSRACLLVLLALANNPALALTSHWTNAVGGNWTDAGNWSDGVPGIGAIAVIDLEGTYTVTLDQSVTVASILLGDLGLAHATLVIQQSLTLTVGDSGITPCVVDSNCTLDIAGALSIEHGPMNFVSYPFWNYGNTIVRSTGSISWINITDEIQNRETGVLTLEGNAQIYATDALHNFGWLYVTGANAHITYSINNEPVGSVIIGGGLTAYQIVNNGTFNILNNAAVWLENGESSGYFANALQGSVVFTGGRSSLDGADISNSNRAHFSNQGTVEISIDTSGVNDDATIGLTVIPSSPPGFIHFTLGNLVLTDTASAVDDSIYIAATCTLRVKGTNFSSTAAVAGPGTVHFAGGDMSIGGRWWFSGGLLVKSANDEPPYITTFQPQPTPPVHIASLTLFPNGTFIPLTTTITVDTIVHAGGTIEGTIDPNYYGWQAGTIGFSAVNGDTTLTIPVGSIMSISGGAAKTLDRIDLVIQGGGTFADSGALSLADSAEVRVQPSGQLHVLGGFTIQGVGELHNIGLTDFDGQSGTIHINVPVVNSSNARTPGTIDILSHQVDFGAGGTNGALITLQAGSVLGLDGEFHNVGQIMVSNGATLTVSGTLVNQNSGAINLGGGCTVTGAGTVRNGGMVGSGGGSLRTTTNISIQPTLLNLADSGLVDVNQDTLTLLNGGTNLGVITIHAGAVLNVYGVFLNDSMGIIQGGGVLDVSNATFTNNGTISPGASPGRLTVVGNITLGAQSRLNMELGGTVAGVTYDLLAVTGSVVLSGTLNLSLVNGYVPALTDTLRVLTYGGATGTFASIIGTQLPNGSFLEISFGPTGLASYVCNGNATITLSASAITDTVLQTVSPLDTFGVTITNSGHCPLTYAAILQNQSPASPAWVHLIPGDESGLLARTQNKPLRLAVNMTGLADGAYGVDVRIANNDPGSGVLTIPVHLTVNHGPDFWDIGGGNHDFVGFFDAASHLMSTPITHPQVFNVYPGTYNSYLSLGQVSGASSANTITFRQADSSQQHPTLYSVDGYTIFLLGTDHLIWDGIDVMTAGPMTAILDSASADSNIFRNCSIHSLDSLNAVGAGVVVGTATNGVLTNENVLLDSVSVYGFLTGISFGRSGTTGNFSGSRMEVRNSSIFNCRTGISVQRQGNVMIHNNLIRPGYSSSTANTRGIEVNTLSGSDTVKVYCNQITDVRGQSTGQGVVVGTGTQGYTLIYNNMLSGWGGTLGATTGLELEASSHAGVYFNSILMSQNQSVASVQIKALLVRDGAAVTATDNVLASEAISDSTFLISLGTAAPAPTLNSDYNCFFGMGSLCFVGQYSTIYPSLIAWQASLNKDLHSRFDIPGFASSTDLHIDGYYRTCDAHGIPVNGITTDIDGQARQLGTPDIGADEFTGITDKIDSLVVKRDVGNEDIQLHWESIAGSLSYRIYSGTNVNTLALTPNLYLGSSSTNSYTHSGAINLSNDRYYYIVRPSTLLAVP